MLARFTYSDKFYLKATNTATLEVLEWTSPETIRLNDALDRAGEWVRLGFDEVMITSATTGELIAECAPEEGEADEYDEYDEYEDDVDECGYNPYMGCYDFDC